MSRRNAAFWAKVNEEYEHGGESMSEVAARHGVKAGTLAWWRCHFRRQKSDHSAQAPAFFPVVVEPQPSIHPFHIEVVLPNGVRMLVDMEWSNERVSDLTAALWRL